MSYRNFLVFLEHSHSHQEGDNDYAYLMGYRKLFSSTENSLRVKVKPEIVPCAVMYLRFVKFERNGRTEHVNESVYISTVPRSMTFADC